jgi:sorting nexin-1/2
VYLDALENQLKALLKAMDSMVAQRKAMAEAAGDLSASLHALATAELSPVLSGPLDALADLQLTMRDVYDRQAQQDVLTMGIVIEEYVRLIGSVKQAFGQRQKAFQGWHTAEAELARRRAAQDKLLRQGRSQQDRLGHVAAEVADAERRVHQARLLFEDMGRLIRAELDRFEREKVEDFKSGVETFLESAIEAQKEVRGLPPPPKLGPLFSGLSRPTRCCWANNTNNNNIAHREMGNVPHAAGRRGRRVCLLQTARCPEQQAGRQYGC